MRSPSRPVVVISLAVLAAVGGSLSAAPAAADETADEPCAVVSARLDWGFKESFRSYISGSIANGEWSVANGAEYETPSFSWPSGSGEYAPGAASVAFVGSITFTGHGGILSTTVSDPRLRIDSERSATLVMDITGTTQEGVAVDAPGTDFVDLDLSAAVVEVVDGVVTITDAPAVLTEAGAEAFGTYEAGEAFDAVSAVLDTAGCAAAAAPTTPEPQPSATAEPSAQQAEESADVPWLPVAAAGAGVLAVLGALLVFWRRRGQVPGA